MGVPRYSKSENAAGNTVIDERVPSSGSVAISNSSTAKTVDVSVATVVPLTMTGNCTLTVSGAVAVPTVSELTLILVQDGTGSRTMTWPSSFKWAGAVAPTLSTAAGAVDIITAFTMDGGTTWYAFFAGKGMA